MKERILHYFAAGNTARGFHSLYESNLADLKKLFILNGGPGTGKSTLMSNIGQHFASQGYSMEYIHSAANHELLEGMIIQELAVGIIAESGLQANDLKVLGGVEQYINLGETRSMEVLIQKKETIDALSNKISQSYQLAYETFAEALSIHDEWEAIYIDNMDFEQANALTDEIIGDLFANQFNQTISNVRHRFLGAATPKGAIDFVPNLTNDVMNRYFIKGRPGSGKSTMLKKIAMQAEERGFDVEIYHCGFDPHSLDMVIVRELGFAIFDSTAPHEYFPSREGDKVIDVYERCISPSTDEDYSLDIENVAQRYRAKMNGATAHLALGKSLADELEKIYRDSVDIDKMKMFEQNIIADIEKLKGN